MSLRPKDDAVAEVLVVDDDPDIGDALVMILRMQGHSVRLACDGEHGLHLLHERIADVLLLDVDMPVLDGPGMSAAMLLHDAGLENVPVVLLSGVPELREVAELVGTPYFLTKPSPLPALDAMLRRALTERIPPRPRPRPKPRRR
jgi:DNA-binding NtrC family response regulator